LFEQSQRVGKIVLKTRQKFLHGGEYNPRAMKLAILGTRGIPANYGGFETFAEELSPRLAARGHDVTVYGRSNNIRYDGSEYKGVKLVILPTIGTKHLDTVTHTFLSVLHAVPRRFDCILICNAANAVFAAVPRLTGTPVALNVDGIERKRKKWGLAGRTYYRLSEYLSTVIPNVIVTDAAVIREYYMERYGAPSRMIAYGANCDPEPTAEIQKKLGVQPRDYLLYVSRLEPENNAHVVIQAYAAVRSEKPLLIVGDAPYAHGYIAGLKATTDARVRFPGAIYGTGYRELQSHAYLYVHATEVGGTHPALIEAMGAGNCVLVYDTPENREVVGDCGMFYSSVEELSRLLQSAIGDPQLVESFQKRARERIQRVYSWDTITDQYEKLFRDLCR
jgi:glycosyltransferase involved in cell wall biosynthesis